MGSGHRLIVDLAQRHLVELLVGLSFLFRRRCRFPAFALGDVAEDFRAKLHLLFLLLQQRLCFSVCRGVSFWHLRRLLGGC